MRFAPTRAAIQRAALAYEQRRKKTEQKDEQVKSSMRQAVDKFQERARIMVQIVEKNQMIYTLEKEVKILNENLLLVNQEQIKYYSNVIIGRRQWRSAKKKQNKEHDNIRISKGRKETLLLNIDYLDLLRGVLVNDLDNVEKSMEALPDGVKASLVQQEEPKTPMLTLASNALDKVRNHRRYMPGNSIVPIQEPVRVSQKVNPPPVNYLSSVPPPISVIKTPPTLLGPWPIGQSPRVFGEIPAFQAAAGLVSLSPIIEMYYYFNQNKLPQDRPPYNAPLIAHSRTAGSLHAAIIPIVQHASLLAKMSSEYLAQPEEILPGAFNDLLSGLLPKPTTDIEEGAMNFMTKVHPATKVLRILEHVEGMRLAKRQDQAIRPEKTAYCQSNLKNTQEMLSNPAMEMAFVSGVFVWPRKQVMALKGPGITKYIREKGIGDLSQSSQMIEHYPRLLSTYLNSIWPKRQEEIASAIGKLSLEAIPASLGRELTENGTLIQKLKQDLRFYQGIFFSPQQLIRARVKLSPPMLAHLTIMYAKCEIFRAAIQQFYNLIVLGTPIISGDKFDSRAPLCIPPYELLQTQEQEEVKKCRWTKFDHKVTESIPFSVAGHRTADVIECMKCGSRCATKMIGNSNFVHLNEDFGMAAESPVFLAYRHCCCKEVPVCLKCCIADWIIMRSMSLNEIAQRNGTELNDILYKDILLPCEGCQMHYNISLLSPITFT